MPEPDASSRRNVRFTRRPPMPRLLLLASLLVAPAAASAQRALFPAGDAGRAVPHWRAALGAGAAEDVAFAVVSLGVDRTLRSPFALGARVAVAPPIGFSDDGPSTTGVAAELRASAGTSLRAFDLRAFAGAGVSAFRTSSGGFGIDIPPEIEPWPAVREPRRVRGRAVAGIGLDVYPAAGVGVGVELRGTLPTGSAELSAGLRVRIAR